ncbi:MAG: radical SAM protein [Candidatus Omnitrophica bacterium]|nr:radical SAM protein [Candidatus Omnitrophota bacterium]
MLSELRLLSRVLRSNVMRLRYPSKLSFAITYRCNLKCGMCSIWKRSRIPELTTAEIEAFFKKSNNFSWVGLTGGEIFLREDIIDIVRVTLKHCKNLCVLHFPTNGYLKDRILLRVGEMLKLKPPRLFVTISVDGPPQIHDRLRGVPGSWKNAVETFIALRGMPGVSPYLSMTLSHGNLGTIDETISSIRDVYPDFDPDKMMNFNIFQTSSHYYANTDLGRLDESLLMKDVEKALTVVGGGSTFKNYLQKNYLKLYESFFRSGKSPLPCQALSASCFINPYGDVFPCAVFDKTIGNIKDPLFTLGDVWNRKDVAVLHHACKTGHCPGCWSPCDAYQTINGNLLRLRS